MWTLLIFDQSDYNLNPHLYSWCLAVMSHQLWLPHLQALHFAPNIFLTNSWSVLHFSLPQIFMMDMRRWSLRDRVHVLEVCLYRWKLMLWSLINPLKSGCQRQPRISLSISPHNFKCWEEVVTAHLKSSGSALTLKVVSNSAIFWQLQL